MRIRTGWLTVISLFLSIQFYGQDITENKFGKGLVNVVAQDSSYSMKMGLRMQTLFTSDWGITEDDGFGTGESAFLIRRARLKFDGFAYSPRLKYKLQLGLSNRDISGASDFTSDAPRYILDAVVMWNFYENFELWAGQTKLPGNREQLISSGSLETVDRSLVNSRFNLGRDLGIQLHHETSLGGDFIMREALSIAQGEGRNVTTGNLGGYQYTARLEFLPLGNFEDYAGADFVREDSPKLAVGFSYDYNDNAVRTRSNAGNYMFIENGFFETDISTIFVDAMFKYEGFSAMGEYAYRDAEDIFARDTDGSLTGDAVNAGSGINLQAGYLFGNNLQLVGRYTNIDLKDEVAQALENQYTLALSKYFVGHKLKVQTDLSYTDMNLGLDDGLMYRLQLELQL
ncbi:porin [Salinimicrobium sediminilitoris]|uniref:porin n=1 Tax=Salinimicrobium sediminilitoris TaxID=2876715 RepID=UPI001E5EACB0|nr:porin [Salinimicrobium sediminilitoris]MCC8360498.1 OprO/OprP family phosphate-selective porin [Salinimicrobium sediminilitoris]